MTALNFFNFLKSRGYIYQCTDAQSFIKQKSLVCYVGFDCTAPSLHIGSLVQIMLIRAVIKFGGKIIALMGDATTRVGDPSGKDSSRPIITQKEIQFNMKSIESIIKRICGDKVIFIKNSDWLDQINYLDLLDKYGRLFSINTMLSYDSVKLRLDRKQHLSFLEFNYMLLQALDFSELCKLHNCNVQFGGSDQWGNIVSGINLCRKLGLGTVYGITTPLLTTSSGKKMGKTEDGAIWLSEDNYYNFWQYFRNSDDADIIKFMYLFTDIPSSEISQICLGNDPHKINKLKKQLATEASKVVYGEEMAHDALTRAEHEFELNSEAFLKEKKCSKNLRLIEFLVIVGFANSNTMSKNLIRNNGVKIDEKLTNDSNHILTYRCKVSFGNKSIIYVPTD